MHISLHTVQYRLKIQEKGRERHSCAEYSVAASQQEGRRFDSWHRDLSDWSLHLLCFLLHYKNLHVRLIWDSKFCQDPKKRMHQYIKNKHFIQKIHLSSKYFKLFFAFYRKVIQIHFVKALNNKNSTNSRKKVQQLLPHQTKVHAGTIIFPHLHLYWLFKLLKRKTFIYFCVLYFFKNTIALLFVMPCVINVFLWAFQYVQANGARYWDAF